MNSDTQIVTPDQLAFGHTIKDAPATCLIMLELAGGQAREVWLERATGYAFHTVHKAMDKLATLGLAARIGQGKAWVTTGKAQQIAMPMALPVQDSRTQNMLPVHVLPTTTTTSYLSELDETVVVEAVENQNMLKVHVLNSYDSPEVEAVLLALHRHGINGDRAREVASKEWVTPEYVDEIWEDSKKRKLRPPYSLTGLAIRRMLDGDLVQKTIDPNDHEADKARRIAEAIKYGFEY